MILKSIGEEFSTWGKDALWEREGKDERKDEILNVLIFSVQALDWMSFGAVSPGLLISHSLEIVVQDDGKVESRLSAATAGSCTRGVLDSCLSGYGTAYAATSAGMTAKEKNKSPRTPLFLRGEEKQKNKDKGWIPDKDVRE